MQIEEREGKLPAGVSVRRDREKPLRRFREDNLKTKYLKTEKRKNKRRAAGDLCPVRETRHRNKKSPMREVGLSITSSS